MKFFKMKTLFCIVLLLNIFQRSLAGNPDVIVRDSVSISAFQELYVSSSIDVILVNSNVHYVYLEGTPTSISSVQIRKAGEKLFISKKGSSRQGKLFVYVPFSFLRVIDAADGAKISSYDPIKGDTLLLSSSDRSLIRIMSEANVIHSISGKNGSVELFGTCNYSFEQSDQNGVSFIELKKQ